MVPESIKSAHPNKLLPRANYLLRPPASIILVGGFFIILAARLFRLTYRYAVNIFFWDQWVFNNAALFEKHSVWEMFDWQYGPHRLGLGPLISTLIEPRFDWNSRAQSFVACSIVVVAAGCALWLKKRLFGGISSYDVAIPLIYFSANQYESLFITSNLAHGPLPLLLVTLYCLAWTTPNVLLKYAIVLLLNFATIYTGFGLFLGFLTPLLLISDYRVNRRTTASMWLYSAIALLIACASLVLFFHGYTQQPAVSCFSLKLGRPLPYVWYMSILLANFFGIRSVGSFARMTGSLILLGLLWILKVTAVRISISASELWTQNAISATLVGFVLLFSANTAFGRLCLGVSSAQASRYTNYIALGVFGGYLYLVSMTPTKIRSGLLTIAVLALLVTIPIRAEDRGTMRFFSEIKRNWKACWLAGGTIPECDKIAGYKIEPEPDTVLQQKMQFLKEHRENLYSESY